jgi:salicylate hydroxylase
VRSSATGSDIMVLPLGREAIARWGAPSLVVHRADLQGALLAAIAETPAITLRTGVEVQGVTREGAGVRVQLRDSTLDCEVLIGADGAQSRIRQWLGLGGEPLFSGRTAWRALVPAHDAPAFARAPETQLWLGSRAHLVHYPLRQGSLINIVAITEDVWHGADETRFWSEPGAARDVLRRFSDWSRDPLRLLEKAPEWRRWPLFDCEPLKRWTSGNVALLGDAAHPMLPFFAQGAAQSIEDAGALGAAFRGAPSITRAFANYERSRVARAARVQSASRRQGVIYHLPGPAGLLRDMALRALPQEAIAARFDWLYTYK